MASNNDQIINALRNLSAPKVQSNSRYTPSQLSQYRSQASVRSASIDALRNAPEYSDQIMRAAAGKSEASGALGNIGKALLDNPISKVVLGGLTILDTGKRAAVSTVREATDYFDTDPNTNASVKDWFSQTKDVTYGFGKAFPMEGWAGRLVGLAGDIALDPITYIPGGAFFQTGRKVTTGAKLATAEGKVLAEFIGGTKSFASREGRTALAGLVSRMGGSAELVQKVGSEGKRALRLSQEGLDMAGKLGMQRSGIYTYGGKARIPFTGPIADAIETGLVKSRLTV